MTFNLRTLNQIRLDQGPSSGLWTSVAWWLTARVWEQKSYWQSSYITPITISCL